MLSVESVIVAAVLTGLAIGIPVGRASLVPLVMHEQDNQVPLNDPQRDPNWCHTHSQMWPACAGEH